MEYIDWHDYVRILAFFVSLYSIGTLLIRKRRDGKMWNTKTRDIWFAFLYWSIAGCVFTVQGIALNLPLNPGFLCLLVAIFVTGKAVHRKGIWGGRAT